VFFDLLILKNAEATKDVVFGVFFDLLILKNAEATKDAKAKRKFL
jgi:hypothetical protein